MSRVLSLDADTALEDRANGAYEATIGDTWWTPRGPLGGFVMAIVLRAMTVAVDDEARRARSFTMHFLRTPAAGTITVTPVVERAGRNLSSLTARVEQDGKLVGLALAAFSLPWESPAYDDAPMPDVAPAEGREPPPDLRAGTARPKFTDLVSMQQRFGDRVFSGSEHALVGGWLGLREERPVDALAVALLADAWLPAPWPRLSEPLGAPTIEMTVHFRAPLPLPDGLLLGRFESKLARDGFFDESGDLWASDGTLVAQSRQLGLLVG